MTQRSRKFVGVFLLLGSLVAYPVLAVLAYELLPETTPIWLVLIYFAIAGMGWVLPAGVIIKWMARPNAV